MGCLRCNVPHEHCISGSAHEPRMLDARGSAALRLRERLYRATRCASAAMLICVVLASCGKVAPPDRSAQRPTAEQTAATVAAAHDHDAPLRTPIAAVTPRVPVLEQTLAYGEAGTRNLLGFL